MINLFRARVRKNNFLNSDIDQPESDFPRPNLSPQHNGHFKRGGISARIRIIFIFWLIKGKLLCVMYPVIDGGICITLS